MYVCVWVSLCVDTHIRYVSTHIYICVCIYVHTHVFTCTHTYLRKLAQSKHSINISDHTCYNFSQQDSKCCASLSKDTTSI